MKTIRLDHFTRTEILELLLAGLKKYNALTESLRQIDARLAGRRYYPKPPSASQRRFYRAVK